MMTQQFETATVGGGCFWCLEAVYQNVKGVHQIVSGYAGGKIKNPTYNEVCGGSTGHAEVIQITFDPAVISYDEILYIFWHIHDPTTLNQQGADIGTQYRSIILYHDENQKAIAGQSVQETDATDLWRNVIVTEVAPIDEFYPAEDYHQNYYRSNPGQPYCVMVVDPKVQKFKKEFQDKFATSS